MKKIFNSFINAVRGLREAYRRDLSFKMEVWAGLVLVAAGYFALPIAEFEFLFLALSFALILIAELINTAFERALERLHPERHELIGISKDIASAAVFVAVLFAAVVVSTIIFARIW